MVECASAIQHLWHPYRWLIHLFLFYLKNPLWYFDFRVAANRSAYQPEKWFNAYFNAALSALLLLNLQEGLDAPRLFLLLKPGLNFSVGEK